LPPEEIPTGQCPECGHSLHGSLAGVPKPKAGEPSVCVHCGALTIFTDKLELRLLDWSEWRLLTHAKKKDLVATRAVILARIRAAKVEALPDKMARSLLSLPQPT